MKIKIGRKEFDITNNDMIFFNGMAYILITKEIFDGYHMAHPSVSKTQFQKFIKSNIITEYKREYAYSTIDGRKIYYIWYKFNVED